MDKKTKAKIMAFLYPFYVVLMYLFIGSAVLCFMINDVIFRRNFTARFITMCLDEFEHEIESWKKDKDGSE